jgi:hypothetical protein
VLARHHLTANRSPPTAQMTRFRRVVWASVVFYFILFIFYVFKSTKTAQTTRLAALFGL